MLGISMDAYGGLLLAYDLLGGQHGPLRLLLRASTYSLIFIAMFITTFGLKFALIAGSGLALVLACELQEAARAGAGRKVGQALPYSLARCLVLGLTIAVCFNIALGIWFAVVGTVLASLLVLTGRARGIEYKQAASANLLLPALGIALARGVLVGIIGLVSGLMVGGDSTLVWFAVEIGLTVGMIIACLGVIAPFVESFVDRVPEKVLGQIGVALFVLGFCVQAAPYAAVLIH